MDNKRVSYLKECLRIDFPEMSATDRRNNAEILEYIGELESERSDLKLQLISCRSKLG
jgi:hypothetical protein